MIDLHHCPHCGWLTTIWPEMREHLKDHKNEGQEGGGK